MSRRTGNLIPAELEKLITATKKDDIVLIYFSGHGSSRFDPRSNDPDKKNETIVPHDSGRIGTDPFNDILDDEIRNTIEQLGAKTSYTTLIFNSCHSGTITRDPDEATARWVAPENQIFEAIGSSANHNDAESLDKVAADSRDTFNNQGTPIRTPYTDEESQRLAGPTGSRELHTHRRLFGRRAILRAYSRWPYQRGAHILSWCAR